MFERGQELGGVWASTNRYPNVTTQNTRDTYTFSDFPMPKHYPEWPTGVQVQEYLTSYARKFDILPSIRFGTSVEQALPRLNGWTRYINKDGVSSEKQVDFLVVCNGGFSEPNKPQVPGRELFGGTVLHLSLIHI